jgi:glycosyltransferase involved in cell wall biosynthesis
VQVYGLSDEFSAVDAQLWQPLVPRTFPAFGPSQFGFSPKLNQAVRESDSDVMHTHGIWQAHVLAPVRWHQRTRAPFIVSPRGMLDPWILRRSPWKKRLACWLYLSEHLAKASCLHALCQSEVESMRAYGLRNPICLIPNGVELAKTADGRLSTLPCPISGVRAAGRKVLLFLSRVHPKKGLINLLKAWSSLGTEHREWTLAIAGWDDCRHEAELKQLATDSRISWADSRELNHRQQSVADASLSLLFLGPQVADGKAACFWNSAAFVLPSFSEGLPMAVLEAWSYAKPVLITPNCNLPEGFAAGAALRIETDPEAMRKGLQLLFSMSDVDRASMGQRGLRLVAERFTWPRIALEVHEVYRWILGGGPKPDSVHCL